MSRAIPAQALAGARQSLAALMADTCTVKRSTSSRTGAATIVGTPATVTTGVPCRVELVDQNPNESQRLAVMERYTDATHNVFFNYNANVLERDTLVIASGQTLRVIALADTQTESFLLNAICKEHE